MTRNLYYPSIVALILSTPVLGDTGEQPASELPANAQRLSSGQIRQAFNDVRDDARVQDSVGTRAVNFWHADGRFTSNWSNAHAGGTVRGYWRTKGDERCVTIESGVPKQANSERCTPLYRYRGEYYSLNPDGTVHGIHRLSPIDQ